jgi:FkbM family methyltransferase
MIKKIKQWLINRLGKILIALTTPGALQARLDGHYFEMYEMVSRLRQMGILPNTILDIGANRGMFTKTSHYVFPDAKIYAFEPLANCYAELKALKTSIPNLETYEVALSDHAGETVIHKSNYDYSSSLLVMGELHKDAFPHTTGVITESIRMENLDGILGEKELQRPMLMKIDVQGYEKFVLDGAVQTLNRCDVIICEMSVLALYKDQALFHDIYIQLIGAGFKYAGNIGELVNPKTSAILQVDGLFIRKTE